MNQPYVEVDIDPQETQEWLDALSAVIDVEGRPRAHYLFGQVWPISTWHAMAICMDG